MIYYNQRLRTLFQPSSFDNCPCKFLICFPMSYNRFSFSVFYINVMISAVSLKLPTITFQKFYKVFCFHCFHSLHLYYTPFMRMRQEVFKNFSKKFFMQAKSTPKSALNVIAIFIIFQVLILQFETYPLLKHYNL